MEGGKEGMETFKVRQRSRIGNISAKGAGQETGVSYTGIRCLAYMTGIHHTNVQVCAAEVWSEGVSPGGGTAPVRTMKRRKREGESDELR